MPVTGMPMTCCSTCEVWLPTLLGPPLLSRNTRRPTSAAARCKDLLGQMLAWVANEGTFPKPGYDGSVRSLAHHFQADEDSPYRQMKWNSQAHFDKTLKVITGTVGDRQIGKLLGPDFVRWHRNWA